MSLSDLAEQLELDPGCVDALGSLKTLVVKTLVERKVKTSTDSVPPSKTLEEVCGELARRNYVHDVIREIKKEFPGNPALAFNAPLSTPSEYFGETNFTQATPDEKASMTKKWKQAVYEGHKGGPSIPETNRILEAAGIQLKKLDDVRKLLTDRAKCTR
jgi:hypothetical protein